MKSYLLYLFILLSVICFISCEEKVPLSEYQALLYEKEQLESELDQVKREKEYLEDELDACSTSLLRCRSDLDDCLIWGN